MMLLHGEYKLQIMNFMPNGLTLKSKYEKRDIIDGNTIFDESIDCGLASPLL